MKHYTELILPLALPQNYTYAVPDHMVNLLKPGMRVVVQFGKRKLYTGLVKCIHQNKPADFEPKEIISIEDEKPIVNTQQFALWEWMAEYYMCTQGEIMIAALPSGLKLESEMSILRNHLKEIVDEELKDHEYLIVEALDKQHSLSIKEISDITGLSNPLRIINDLLGKRYILLDEELKQGYKPIQKRMVKLTKTFSEVEVNTLFENLNRAPKQRDLLLGFFKLQASKKKIVAAKLLKESKSNEASLKALEKKGILELYYDLEEKLIDNNLPEKLKELNTDQAEALQELKHLWQEKDVNLLLGVTSSGKTEIYSQLISKNLKEGKQVLYLVPEIALTTQLINRLKKHFENQVVVYHSRFSDRERVETWLELSKSNSPKLILGARSSVFLPFSHIGLVVVDEEHETSYKQFDPAPRYHARDTAIVLASMHKAHVLLGSATPSFESYFNAQQGKYGFVPLLKRFGGIPLPEIHCVDLKEELRKKRMHGPFSEYLQNALSEVLKEGKQAILFQNRRGFSTVVQCQTCGHVAQCKNCDISLTYHRHSDLLRCHYCGYSNQVPKRCGACNSHDLRSFGLGTEKLEDDLKLMFPEAIVKRMDLDTTRKKNAYANIIADFESGETDILVGTQMVTKGLDFENVALVGIMNADSLLNFPDFRAHERAFQLLAQVSGRAGRKGKRGKVIVQSSEPYHHVIRKVMDNAYEPFYKEEVYDRKNFKYPPFYRLIKITLKHKDRTHLEQRAKLLGSTWKSIFGDRVLGPEFPPIARLRNQYQMEAMLKLESEASLVKVKKLLRKSLEDFELKYPGKKIQVIFDVDSY